MKAYKKLTEIFHKIDKIQHAITFLQWDQLVMMPPGGNESRSQSLAELTTLCHSLLTSAEVGELIAEAREDHQYDNETQVSIKEMDRTYSRAACLPTDLVTKKSLAGSTCEHGWRTQRDENDWEGFLKNFREVVTLAREEAQARQEQSTIHFETPYDAMLDLYCTGDDSKKINDIFSLLKNKLPDLLQLAVEKQPPKTPLPQGSYPTEKQLGLNRKLMEYLGFDFSKGRIDLSLHPFSTGDLGDQRITTRFTDNEFLEALLATAHETGHASYESGLPIKFRGLPIGRARNMCLHESQSLLFEKHIFLSRHFFTFFFREIFTYFPETGALSAEQLWQNCCHVEPSYIRVEADEVSYPLHVIVRFEIEQDLINNTITPEDIPEIWDEKMFSYLGLRTGNNHRIGCLQDIHWTDGSFGYFPSYTIGAINSAQLFQAIKREYTDWPTMLEKGEVAFIREWLDKNIWKHSSQLSSQEIMNRATGDETAAQYLLNHITARYIDPAPM